MMECHASAKELVKVLTGHGDDKEDKEVEFEDIKPQNSGKGTDKIFTEMTKPEPRVIYVDVVPPPSDHITFKSHHSFAIVTTGVNGNFKMIQSWMKQYQQEISIDTTSSTNAMETTRDFVLNMIKTGGDAMHYHKNSMKSLFFPGSKPLPMFSIYEPVAEDCKFEYKTYPISGCSFRKPTDDDRTVPSNMLRIGAHAFSHRKSNQAIQAISERKEEEIGDINLYCKAFCSKLHSRFSFFKGGCKKECRKIEETAMESA